MYTEFQDDLMYRSIYWESFNKRVIDSEQTELANKLTRAITDALASAAVNAVKQNELAKMAIERISKEKKFCLKTSFIALIALIVAILLHNRAFNFIFLVEYVAFGLFVYYHLKFIYLSIRKRRLLKSSKFGQVK